MVPKRASNEWRREWRAHLRRSKRARKITQIASHLQPTALLCEVGEFSLDVRVHGGFAVEVVVVRDGVVGPFFGVRERAPDVPGERGCAGGGGGDVVA